MNYIYCDEIKTNAVFTVQTKATSGLCNDVIPPMYVEGLYADEVGKTLSLAFPYAEVTINCMARVKARYMNGVRVTLTKMEDFFNNLTPEQIADSRIYISAGVWE